MIMRKAMNTTETKLSALVVVISLVLVVALLSLMGERDYQHAQEVAELRAEIARLSVEYDEPTIELSMPIDLNRVKI